MFALVDMYPRVNVPLDLSLEMATYRDEYSIGTSMASI